MIPGTILVAGDTFNPAPVTVAGFPSTVWTLKYQLVPRAGTASVITLVATSQGTDFLLQYGPSSTSGWAPGVYDWFSWVEQPGARRSIDKGWLTILPDPATLAPGSDSRTTARKTLDSLQAALATYRSSSGHVKSYSIGGRTMTFDAEADIQARLDAAKQDVQNEQVRQALSEGKRNPRNLGVQFNRI